MRLWFQRIPEEDDEVDRAFGNLRANLLIAAQRTALQARDGQIEFRFQDGARGSSGIQIVMGQQVAVELGPIKHVLLLVVVGHQRDLLARSHGNRFIDHSFRAPFVARGWFVLFGTSILTTAAAVPTINNLIETEIIFRSKDLQSSVVTSPIRVVAVDIDGTLTDPQFHVSDRNIAALRAAHEAGIQIILATGRRHDYAMPIARELGIPILLVSSNGALVRSSDGETLFTECLAASTARKLIRHMDQ